MNQLEFKRFELENMRKLEFTSSRHINCIRINSHNTYEHEHDKFRVCLLLSSRGLKYITEAVFKDKYRADVYCISNDVVYEILNSETEEKFKEKKYPASEIRALRVGEWKDEDLD
ncbi:MAG: hypothetical protein QME12_07705 [Nanoarchaeota archaeon]|nr:hypothetical protein [Nanoarchaeota archaeon]